MITLRLLNRAEADSQENWMDLQYENHCRAGGGGENNPNVHEMKTNMSERHQKRDNSTTSSVSSSQKDYDGAAAGAAPASKMRSKPS
jgi:hypothetical protein